MPVLDNEAPQGFSDLSEDDIDSFDGDSYMDEDMGIGTNRRTGPRRTFIDLTSPGYGRRGLEVVEEDSESEDEDDTSMQDFVVQDGLSSPPRIRGANRRRQREASIVSLDTTISTSATVSSPVAQPRNRRQRVIDDSDEDEEEEDEPVSMPTRRAVRRNVIPSTSEADEDDSSEAAGGARFGNGRGYPTASSDNESDDREHLLSTGYQALDDDTGGTEEESDAPFSPSEPPSSQMTNSSFERDRTTPTLNHFSSPAPYQPSSPPSSRTPNRPYRNNRRRIIEDDDDEEEWESSEEENHDREGDFNMNRAQQGASISRPSTVQRVRNRRGLMSPVNNARRRVIPNSSSTSHDSDGDSTTDTMSNSGRDNRRTVRTVRGAETTFFSNHRQPNRPHSRTGRQNGVVDPNIRQLLSNFRRQQEASQQARIPNNDLADLGLSAPRSVSPSRSMTPAGATDREATPTNAPNLSSSAPSQNAFNPASMMSNLGNQRPTNTGFMSSLQTSPHNQNQNQGQNQTRNNARPPPAHASFSPQLSSAPPRTAPSPAHLRSPFARIHRTSSRNGMRSPGSRNGMRLTTASPIGSNLNMGYTIGNNNPWNGRLLRSSASPAASPNLLSPEQPRNMRYQSAPAAEVPSSPPFMQRHTSDSIYQYGQTIMQQRARNMQAQTSSDMNFGSSPQAQPQSRLLSNANPTGMSQQRQQQNAFGNSPSHPISISSTQNSPAGFPYQSFGQALGQQPLSPQNNGYGMRMGEQDSNRQNPMYVVGREST